MRQELIDQTQEMAAAATTALGSILALHAYRLAEVDSALDNPAQAGYIRAR